MRHAFALCFWFTAAVLGHSQGVVQDRDGRPEIAVGHMNLDFGDGGAWVLELALPPRILPRSF